MIFISNVYVFQAKAPPNPSSPQWNSIDNTQVEYMYVHTFEWCVYKVLFSFQGGRFGVVMEVWRREIFTKMLIRTLIPTYTVWKYSLLLYLCKILLTVFSIWNTNFPILIIPLCGYYGFFFFVLAFLLLLLYKSF